MTPDLFSAKIVCDTSILRGAGVASAPYQVLKGLVGAGLAEVYIPELVLEEYRTQWRDTVQSNVTAGLKALEALNSDSLLSSKSLSTVKQSLAELNDLDIESLSGEYITSFIQDTGFQAYPLTFEQAKTAWIRYFSGRLPSKRIKFRSDIPDAHVLAAVAEMREKTDQVLFVCADKLLREAGKDIDGVACFEDFDSLLESHFIGTYLTKWQLEEKWVSFKNSLDYNLVQKQVSDFVFEHGGGLLSYQEVHDAQIPEDNNTASITLYGEAEEIEINDPRDWGGGFLRYTVTFFSECLLSFSVYRADAFDVPEWVSVTIGDPETDHYFDAEGYAVVIVTVDVTVRINLNSSGDNDDDLIDEISFDTNSLEMSLSET